MKTSTEFYNPLSMSEVVRRRIEKRADGAEYRNQLPLQARQTGSPQVNKSSTPHTDLEDTFFQMLVRHETSEPGSECVESNIPKNSKSNGTKPCFFSLKEGEEKKEKVKANEFSFSIPNSHLGTLFLKGQYEEGVMTVVLNVQKPVDLREKVMLERFLKFRLSEVLQVHVEIKIG